MSRTDPLIAAIRTCPAFEELASAPPREGGVARVRTGGGSATVLLAALHESLADRLFVVVASGPREAATLEHDLSGLIDAEVAVFPQLENLPSEDLEGDPEIEGLRVEALEGLFSGTRLLVTTPRALLEKSRLPRRLTDLRLTVSVGDSWGVRPLAERLEEHGFNRAPVVEQVGQYAIRGGIVDFFSLGYAEPHRVEFWGDEITSIRCFDVLDQRSVRRVEAADVLPMALPAVEEDVGHQTRSLLHLLPTSAIVAETSPETGDLVERAWRHAGEVRREVLAEGQAVPSVEAMFHSPAEFRERIGAFARVVLDEEGPIDLGAEPPPEIDRDLKRLTATLGDAAARGQESLILCDNEGQYQRLEELIGETLPPGARIGLGSLASGFDLRCSDPPLLVLTDHEIFRRSRRVRGTRRFRGAVALENLQQLSPGDYVVHMDHGVGRFRGMEQIEVAGEVFEVLAIEYAGEEMLRVPVYRLDLIERWVGDTEQSDPPQVHRIGGKRWKTLRRKTEAAIEEMTAELLELYARRATATGFAFSEDTPWQLEMESSFLYEDTPDQRKVTAEVKRDMESPRPMDRLVCGDVGYGKTEIALRAAFKAVQDGKQVAVLAPTTILVEQHRHTFEERLADFPVHVGALSRFRTATETRDLLTGAASGSLDILIGTHRMLGTDVRFKDLGLLIVDEEQRFGVKHKERLKALRASVDVLTLTATPIPRTLYLSLSRIRDLSLIRTPPRDRVPIVTHVVPWSDHLVAEALYRELDRDGQSFVLHNRVETIRSTAERVRRLVPDARVDVAHGQMGARDLDRVMSRFVDGEVDVLVCSSIIENGLDVPNANTLIVERADHFGLSQLYQIRGRVGRSDRRAYCYLVVPPDVNEEAERRLRVLEHYTELGSGYAVALRDLELRGAGNLLGAEQSGFASVVGIEAYLRLLERTVERLRSERGEESFPDPDVSMGGAAYVPDDYLPEPTQKLALYRRLSKARRTREVDELGMEIRDRFGAPPPEVDRLLTQAKLRVLGRSLGVERILVRRRSARVNFREEASPRLSVLQGPLREGQVEVTIRRMQPLSLELDQIGAEGLLPALLNALEALRRARESRPVAQDAAPEGPRA